MSMVTVAMVVLPITPTPAAIPPPRHVSLFEFSASTPPQTSPKSSWFSPNNGRAISVLNLYRNAIGPEGAALLATSRCLKSLVELWLQGNNIGDAGTEALVASLRGP